MISLVRQRAGLVVSQKSLQPIYQRKLTVYCKNSSHRTMEGRKVEKYFFALSVEKLVKGQKQEVELAVVGRD